MNETTPPRGESDPLRKAVRILEVTPDVVARLLAGVDASVLSRRPAPEEWSPQEVLTHLRHIEDVLRPRIAAMAAAPEPIPLAPAPPMPEPGDVGATLAAWRAARTDTLRWLTTLGPAELERAGLHRRFGRITVREHIVEWAYHDLDHTRQLVAGLQAALYSALGPWQGLYPRPFGGGA